jgi:hypothetical protein
VRMAVTTTTRNTVLGCTPLPFRKRAAAMPLRADALMIRNAG